MRESGRTGPIAMIAGRSPNLASAESSPLLAYETARPGSASCVEPGHLFGTTSRLAPVLACHFATAFTSAHLRLLPADVLFRSGPEITS